MTQLLPLQGTLPAQELIPRHEIRFEPALLDTPAAQDRAPEQLAVHMFPEQVTIPWQELVPEQVMVLVAPRAVTPLPQELVPLQVTLQVEPPHWTPPPQALFAH